MENVYGQYRRVLNVRKNALKRVQPVPAGTYIWQQLRSLAINIEE